MDYKRWLEDKNEFENGGVCKLEFQNVAFNMVDNAQGIMESLLQTIRKRNLLIKQLRHERDCANEHARLREKELGEYLQSTK